MPAGIEIEVGRRLRQLRQSRGLSISIAEKVRAAYSVKLDRSHLSRMERGKASIPLRTLFALVDFYEADMVDVLPNPHEAVSRPLDPLLERIRQAPGLGNRLTELYTRLGPDRLEEVLFTLTDAILSCLPDRRVRRRSLHVAEPQPAPNRRKAAQPPHTDRPESQ